MKQYFVKWKHKNDIFYYEPFDAEIGQNSVQTLINIKRAIKNVYVSYIEHIDNIHIESIQLLN